MKKAYIFCSKGLGDSLIFALLANNLKRNNYEPILFHNFLDEINDLFDFEIKKYPKEDEIEDLLDLSSLIIINSDSQNINQKVLKTAKDKHNDKLFELHPSTCKGNKGFIGDHKFNINKTMLDNLIDFCHKKLKLNNLVKDNGLKNFEDLIYRKYKKRVIIHPSSSDINKNWPEKKYIKLIKKLEKKDFEPKIILKNDEINNFSILKNYALKFNNLLEMSKYIYESGFMIGNDSGIGHLASNLKIPTLIIFSSRRKKDFWRCDFYKNEIVYPYPILNIKGLRLRDKYWYKTIYTSKVFNKFINLTKDFL
ncbi:MAG: hypothetical protein K1060chlam5_00731 [Candidatus Anoxychlamydiales bacterium]|nr:hypothetical protein [Candidatus Anoxychlamydiales bacterium]